MYTKAIQPARIIGIALLLGLNGCLSAKDSTNSDTIHPAQAKLTRADDCDDLLVKIQQDVIAKVDLYAQALRFPDKYYYSPGGEVVLIGPGTTSDAGAWTNSGSKSGSSGAPGSASFGAGGSSAAIGTSSSNGASSNGDNQNVTTPDSDAYDSAGETGAAGARSTSAPSSFSTTTKQVEAVDEPDIVKTDGRFLYILHGNSLFILKAWEPASLKEESKIAIEGSTREMLVYKGKAVVFSTVYDNNGTIRGIAADPAIAPKGSAGYGYRYDDPYYGPYEAAAFTKITVVDVASSNEPKAVRELYIEGGYLSARLYADTHKDNGEHGVVRAIVTGGFKAPNIYNANIEYANSWGKPYDQDAIDEQVNAWRDRIVGDIQATGLQDWLPIEKEKVDDTFTDVQWLCEEFYAPSPGLTEYGVTNIVAFDLSDKPKTALAGASVLGDAAEVYSNENALVLAHADWSWQMRTAVVSGERINGEQIALHRFNLQGLTTEYAASGFVPGHIVDQFSIDESAGIIRVSTTQDVQNNWVTSDLSPTRADVGATTTALLAQGPENRVITLEAKEGKLVQVGISEALGKPGERTKSTRFLGDTAYVVTFRQVDPLIVLDIKDPAKIRVVGEVTIPGFSEYIHPIDQGHLLTIGRDTNEFSRDSGLLLQIFDVTNPANPTQAFKYSYTRQGWSEANQNHKAFSYFADKKLLAFPFASYDYPMVSTLELFRVDTASGFEPLGSIDHTDLFMANAACKTAIEAWGRFDSSACARPSAEVRRGVFISGAIGGAEAESDFIYSISYAGVKVHDINHLDQAIASVSLPAIESTDGSYNGGAFVGTGATAGAWTAGSGGAFVNTGAGGAMAGTGQPWVDGGAAGAGGEIPVDAGSPRDSDSSAGEAGYSADGGVPGI